MPVLSNVRQQGSNVLKTENKTVGSIVTRGFIPAGTFAGGNSLAGYAAATSSSKWSMEAYQDFMSVRSRASRKPDATG